MKKILFFFAISAGLQAGPVEDLKKNVCDTLPGFYGWCTPEKANHFIDLVLETKPEVCVEIGVFGGRSLYPVAKALQYLDHGIVIGIDPWDKDECIRAFDPTKDQAHINWWSKINIEHVFHSYLNMISQYQLEDHIITLKATSEHAANVIGNIDILYIDGNHSEESSVQDVKLYLPKVKAGGYIWLNDSLSLDLQEAMDILLDECDFIELIDNGNCILFRKK